jgi:hypothetical protein
MASLLALSKLAAADVEIHGFVEAAVGVRTAEPPAQGGDTTLEEARAQIRVSAASEKGEAFARLDALQDSFAAESELELREGFLRFTTLGDHLDVKAGRQILTWGTGDLVFVNDLFPKDWESFFAGREDQYLKAPSNSIRLEAFGLPAEIDFVWTPSFTADRFPAPGSRFLLAAPVAVTPETPLETLENGELSLRVSRYSGDALISLYGYRGFFKTPAGTRIEAEGESFRIMPFHPELSVFGASLRGSMKGAILWWEGGFYDSREDRDGDNPRVENQSARLLFGCERQIVADFQVSAQYLFTKFLDVTVFAQIPEAPPLPPQEERSHLLTLRLEKLLRYQTVRLSFFSYWDPDEKDSYLRPLVAWDATDEVDVVLGANVFFPGDAGAGSPFAPFDEDDNVYLRLRASF